MAGRIVTSRRRAVPTRAVDEIYDRYSSPVGDAGDYPRLSSSAVAQPTPARHQYTAWLCPIGEWAGMGERRELGRLKLGASVALHDANRSAQIIEAVKRSRKEGTDISPGSYVLTVTSRGTQFVCNYIISVTDDDVVPGFAI